MAHVQKRNQGGKTTWRARVRLPDGRERSKSFDRKVDAERWVVETQAQLNRGNVIDPRAGQITLAEYAAQWQAAQMHRPSTAEATESRLRRHVLPTFGQRPIGSLRPSEVRAWVKGLSGKLAPTTVEACYRLLATILKAAVDDRLLPSSPCVRVRLPDKFTGDVVPLTVEQVDAVRGEMPERLRAAVTLAAGVGLRRGEVLGLSVDRVDFLRRQLTVDRQLLKVTGSADAFGPPKTRASLRTVPVPDIVLEDLSRHLAKHPAEPDLVFVNARGRPWSYSRFAEVWRAAADGAGLPEGTRFHDLRHHTASLLIAAGCSVKVVQRQLGHSSATETLDTYGHLWPTDEDRVRAAVNRAFTRRSTDRSPVSEQAEPLD
ncbi:MAG TPA: tyrosine-type recombinase/integrase [Acidimicrobiales bacterium]|nr:tyrosine-type recombinase/integrase [Acidimicrobiales bacterium]